MAVMFDEENETKDINNDYNNDEKKKENAFNFDIWIDKFGLNDIKECFIKYELTTLDALVMDNENYMKLLSDNKIMCKPYLYVNINKGMLSLNELRKPPNELIILSQNENQQLINIKNYIDDLDKKQNELESATRNKLEKIYIYHNEQIKQYESKKLIELKQIDESITNYFNTLQTKLGLKKKELLEKVDNYENELDEYKKEMKDKEKICNGKLEKCLSFIDDDIKHFNYSINQCLNVVDKYDTNNDIQYQRITFTSSNKQRSNEIGDVGKKATNYYNKRIILLNKYEKEIKQYIKNKMETINNNISLNIDKNNYNHIVNDMEKLIKVDTK